MANRVWFVYPMLKGRQVRKVTRSAMVILGEKEKVPAVTETLHK